jgi:ketosteroid isomerase-like protein
MSDQSSKKNHDGGIEARVRRLEDLEAIRQLKHLYADRVDGMVRNSDADTAPLLALFTEDALADFGPHGSCEGHAAIHAFFARMPDLASFMMHHLANPILDVDGDRATARWYLHVASVMRGAGPGVQAMFGRYEDEYVRTPEGWKIRRSRFIQEGPAGGG